MILNCQYCGKRYLVKDEMIGPKGRKVRCVACNHTWLQERLEEPYEPGDETESINQAEESPSLRPSSKTFSLPFGILCFVAAILLSLGSLYIARYSIVHMWPPAKQAYQMVGLSVTPPGAGLKIENTSSMYMEENGKTYLIVKGEVVNTSQQVITIPPLIINLRGSCEQLGWFSRVWSWLMGEKTVENNCILQKWRHIFSENRLFSGERVAFETEPYVTVPGATNIVIHF
ncbi:MAG: zinc-ribbon domain-containing protein [Alphaproteobacteria bacterium]|nr:zinc-ribbon domain-containing protein [Alphaproteobacteria bacterium]